MEKMQEMFTKDLQELKNKQIEMNNTLEGINSRITEAEERISELEDRMMEITSKEQNKGKMRVIKLVLFSVTLKMMCDSLPCGFANPKLCTVHQTLFSSFPATSFT